jgi:hypothetical protein
MCPDRKLKWFKDRGHTAAQIEEIRKLVINRWVESYKPVTEARSGCRVAAPVAGVSSFM